MSASPAERARALFEQSLGLATDPGRTVVGGPGFTGHPDALPAPQARHGGNLAASAAGVQRPLDPAARDNLVLTGPIDTARLVITVKGSRNVVPIGRSHKFADRVTVVGDDKLRFIGEGGTSNQGHFMLRSVRLGPASDRARAPWCSRASAWAKGRWSVPVRWSAAICPDAVSPSAPRPGCCARACRGRATRRPHEAAVRQFAPHRVAVLQPDDEALCEAERLRLLASVAGHNQALARDHGVCFDDQLPADEAAAPQEDVDSAYLLELLARLSLSGEPPPAGLSPR